MNKIQKHPSSTLPMHVFLKKLSYNFILGMLIIFFSLSLGIFGYHYFEKMSWIDAYLNAAMILSGMGPVTELKTVEGKLFAGFFALFSGVIFLVVIAIIFSPLLHRFFHRYFHLQEQ